MKPFRFFFQPQLFRFIFPVNILVAVPISVSFFYDLVIPDVDHNLSCHGRPISSSYDLDLSSNTNRDASVELSSIQTLWP